MIEEQTKVLAFHKAFDIEINNRPTLPDDATKQLRINLIEEEFDELKEALEANDIVEVADALGDLLYVVYGTAVSCGLNMKPIYDEIHRSNMTKVGGWVREDGKYMKPDSYSPANLSPIINDQLKGENAK